MFSFAGHNGGNISYRCADLDNPETMPADIKVSEWNNYGDVSNVEHKTDYNGGYYTSGDYYVYNDPGAVIRGNVVATLTTYDSNGEYFRPKALVLTVCQHL